MQNYKLTPSELNAQGMTYVPCPDEIRRIINREYGPRALALYTEALSHAQHFWVKARDLARALGWNEKTVTKYLKALNQLGLAVMRKIRNATTKQFEGSRWYFSMTPRDDWKPEEAEPVAEVQTDFFDSRDTKTPTPPKTVPENISTTTDKTKINLSTPDGAACDAQTIEQGFDVFWHAYPSREKKKRARAKYEAIAKKMTVSQYEAWQARILEDIRLRRRFDERWLRGIIPHAVTYLHDERWEDEWRPNLNGSPLENQWGSLKLHVEMGGSVAEWLGDHYM